MPDDRVLRHPNGGALKIGTEVHVSADSFCDERSEIGGDSSVFQSTLKDSMLLDSRLFDSAVETAWLIRSVCAKSTLQGVVAQDSTLDRVIASTNGVAGILTLRDVVAETCELHGTWSLEGNARIPTGCWYRPPRYLRITGENGVDVGLTESTEGHALMACWRKPITTWLHAGPRLGQKHHWSWMQIVAAKDFFTTLLDQPLEGVQQ